ncbi:hypothetical protein SRABI76_00117 [Microbacterium oxydans]|uniref:Uncharacterized protein n=1 Tax=Microbacterium oxydans TaxID=82380 RepID=A0A0F0L4N8_9MICO|nr:hypothetical protein [Microbacterium oxydans]KJL28137.1 hypothetical protein RS83_03204 [Microbacterium oxydans]CAH0125018.1 hypothetical protein SRABI76_00117 [Microbacterium oxydans]
MSDARIEAPEASGARRGPRWLTGLVLGLAGLFYAYAVWNAVAHLVGFARSGLTGIGWVTLLFGVIFPALVFAFAFVIGRRRSIGELALVLLAGLGVVAVFWLSLLGYSVLNMRELIDVAPLS